MKSNKTNIWIWNLSFWIFLVIVVIVDFIAIIEWQRTLYRMKFLIGKLWEIFATKFLQKKTVLSRNENSFRGSFFLETVKATSTGRRRWSLSNKQTKWWVVFGVGNSFQLIEVPYRFQWPIKKNRLLVTLVLRCRISPLGKNHRFSMVIHRNFKLM